MTAETKSQKFMIYGFLPMCMYVVHTCDINWYIFDEQAGIARIGGTRGEGSFDEPFMKK